MGEILVKILSVFWVLYLLAYGLDNMCTRLYCLLNRRQLIQNALGRFLDAGLIVGFVLFCIYPKEILQIWGL